MSRKKTKGEQLTRKNSKPAPIKNAPDAEIPAFLSMFKGKSVQQVVAMMVPQTKGNEQADAGFASSVYDTGVPVPEWVKRASQKALEDLPVDLITELLANPEAELVGERLGELIGLAEIMLKTRPAPPGSQLEETYKNVIAPFTAFMNASASKEEPEKAAAFFSGRKEAATVAETLTQPSQRAKIYRIIADRWQEVDKLKSTGELHSWLLSLRHADGKSYIAPETDSREVRKVCDKIGLKFQNQWRKPKP